MKKGLNEIVFVLDMTGSMETLKADTIGGFNNFVNEQKQGSGEATMSLIVFNSSEYRKVFENKKIENVKPLTEKEYRPSAMTPLLDAIGRTINEVGNRLDKTPENDKPEKVILVILTDGEENSSREFSRDKIFEMINHQRDKYSWEFIFLGANQDAFLEAGKLGIRAIDIQNFYYTSAGIAYTYTTSSNAVKSYRVSK